ncbi:MAG: sugar phosphate isomerase/epimerase [Planctomycetales bacterium]
MSDPSTRRTFLRDGALLATGAAVGTFTAGLHSRPAQAVEPIKRNGTAQFKFSLAAYSYRKLLSGAKPELTLENFITDCAAMGLEGTELTSYYFPKNPTREFLAGLKGFAFRLGLDVSGTAVGNDFCHPPGEKRDAKIAHVKRWIEHAEILGAPVIRIFSGRPRGDQTEDQARKLAIEAIEECCDHAGKHGVHLALENHGGLTTSVDGMLQLVQAVKSPWFGVNLDSGNFRGETLYDDLAKIAPYALNAQIKVVVHPQSGKNEPTDFPRLAKIMRDAGYRGYIVLEYEEGEDPRKACPPFVEILRKAFA